MHDETGLRLPTPSPQAKHQPAKERSVCWGLTAADKCHVTRLYDAICPASCSLCNALLVSQSITSRERGSRKAGWGSFDFGVQERDRGTGKGEGCSLTDPLQLAVGQGSQVVLGSGAPPSLGPKAPGRPHAYAMATSTFPLNSSQLTSSPPLRFLSSSSVSSASSQYPFAILILILQPSTG